MPVAGVVTVRGINPREGIHGATKIEGACMDKIYRIPRKQ